MNAPELRFDQLRSTHQRTQPVRGIVIHFTGGSGGPEQVYRTLRSRVGPHSPDGLSVHYVVGSDGEVVQMCAHDRVCLHAGVANEWSIGIECVSPGIAMGSAYAAEAKRGVHREVYIDRPRGGAHKVRMLDFTPPQTASLVLLVETLCDTLSVPRRVPMEGERYSPRQFTPAEFASYRGVLGHLHVHPTKTDPGGRIFETLLERWR